MNCVYKIVCKDPTITEFYIGSTNNLNRRIIEHNSSCNNTNSHNHNYKIYKYIRENGGLDNWQILVEQETPNYEKYDREILEQSYIDLLEPQLNTQNAFGTDTKKSMKKWRENNIEHIKQYIEKNKEKIAKKKKDRYNKNKEKVLNINKKWASKKYICNICNQSLSISNKSRHIKLKHSS